MQSQVRLNGVPEKVPEKVWRVWCRARSSLTGFRREGPGAEKVLEKVWENLVQSRVKFNRVEEKILEEVPEKIPEKLWETLVQSQLMFNSVPEKVPEKAPEKVWETLVQSYIRFQQVSKEGSGEGLGGFGAEPSQVK